MSTRFDVRAARHAARIVLFLALGACAGRPAAPDHVPGLGEIMSLNQMRHAKLWWAGTAGNWPLASYELDELGEGFDDAVEFHPTHKDAPIAIKDAIPAMIEGPLGTLRRAVDAQDGDAFRTAFDALTTACNACHRATEFGFNVVTRPTVNTFSNQAFAPPSDAASPAAVVGRGSPDEVFRGAQECAVCRLVRELSCDAESGEILDVREERASEGTRRVLALEPGHEHAWFRVGCWVKDGVILDQVIPSALAIDDETWLAAYVAAPQSVRLELDTLARAGFDIDEAQRARLEALQGLAGGSAR
ncbi:MAG: hypothetical protein H6825_09005 [Planctomycetes bacterium]|nr:hypothetical protein [Planctomycetota bacterium]